MWSSSEFVLSLYKALLSVCESSSARTYMSVTNNVHQGLFLCMQRAFLSLCKDLLSVCEALLCVYRGSGRRHLSMMTQILGGICL